MYLAPTAVAGNQSAAADVLRIGMRSAGFWASATKRMWRAMRHGLTIGAPIVIMAVAAVSGCGGEAGEPAPRLASPVTWGRPPLAVLTAGDARQTGGLGSFCWVFCADAHSLVVPTEPVAVPTGSPLAFELGFDPTEAVVTVWRADGGKVVEEPRDGTALWEGGSQQEAVFAQAPTLGRRLQLRPDLQPGRYMVELSVRAAKGSASYGFQLEIVP
jgi:hypothetical protein